MSWYHFSRSLLLFNVAITVTCNYVLSRRISLGCPFNGKWDDSGIFWRLTLLEVNEIRLDANVRSFEVFYLKKNKSKATWFLNEFHNERMKPSFFNWGESVLGSAVSGTDAPSIEYLRKQGRKVKALPMDRRMDGRKDGWTSALIAPSWESSLIYRLY